MKGNYRVELSAVPVCVVECNVFAAVGDGGGEASVIAGDADLGQLGFFRLLTTHLCGRNTHTHKT